MTSGPASASASGLRASADVVSSVDRMADQMQMAGLENNKHPNMYIYVHSLPFELFITQLGEDFDQIIYLIIQAAFSSITYAHLGRDSLRIFC
jgi:hypothetical protein